MKALLNQWPGLYLSWPTKGLYNSISVRLMSLCNKHDLFRMYWYIILLYNLKINEKYSLFHISNELTITMHDKLFSFVCLNNKIWTVQPCTLYYMIASLGAVRSEYRTIYVYIYIYSQIDRWRKLYNWWNCMSLSYSVLPVFLVKRFTKTSDRKFNIPASC